MPRDRRDDDLFEDDDLRRQYPGGDRDEDRPRRRREDRDDGYEDRPRREPEPLTNGAAVTALVLGVVSFVGGVTAIPGLICGFVGLSKAKKRGGAGKGMALAGTILSGVGLIVLGLTVWLATALFKPRDSASARMMSSNNMKQIGIAIHSHHDANDRMPAPFVESPFAPPGQPVRESELSSKLSWRVTILPFVEEDRVFRQMDLRQPWDSPQNRPLASKVILPYTDPETRTDPATRYRVFYGPETAFPLTGRMGMANITDGTSNTVFAVESGEKVTWSQFNEMKFDPANPPSPGTMGRPVNTGFMVLMGDGSIRTFRKTMNPQTLKAAITPNGGEVVNLDD